MNDREKLVELLGHVQYLGGLEEKIADHLIAHGVTVQKWVPVSERLPEDFAQVLICSVIGNQYVAQHLRGHFYSDGINIGTSHWMPLPEPPKESE